MTTDVAQSSGFTTELRGPWRYLFAAIAFGGGLPLFAARHLPFSDLPEHVAVIATLRHWWDPAWRSQELFTVDSAFRTQYWLYDLVGALLAVPLGSAERANLVLLFLTAVGMPYALRELLRAARHDERLALLGVPLFWNRALAEGLLNFVASIPVCIFALALALEQSASPTRRRGLALSGLALALFYLHLSSFVLFALGAMLFAFVFEWRRGSRLGVLGRAVSSSLWALPVVAAGLLFVSTSTVTHPDRSQGAHAEIVRFFPKLVLLHELPGWMHDFWTSRMDEVAAAIAWLGVVVTFVPMGRARPIAPARSGEAQDAPAAQDDHAEHTRLLLARLLVVLAAGLYFLLPSQVGFAFILDLRMAPFVGLCAVALARRRVGKVATAAASLVAAGAVISVVSCIIEMRAFEKEEAAYIDLMLRRLPFGKRLLTLAFDAESPRTVIPRAAWRLNLTHVTFTAPSPKNKRKNI